MLNSKCTFQGENDIKVWAIVWKILKKLTGKWSSMLLTSVGPVCWSYGSRKGRSQGLWSDRREFLTSVLGHTSHLVEWKNQQLLSLVPNLHVNFLISGVLRRHPSWVRELSSRTSALRQGASCSTGLDVGLSWSCIISSSFIYLIRTDPNVFFLMAEYIPLCICTTAFLSIRLLMDI